MKIIHRHLIFGHERFDRCCESALRELARSAKAPRWHLLATSPCVTWARDRRAHAAPGFLLRPAARGPGHLGFAPAPDPESRPRTRCDVPVPLPPPPPHTCPLHPLTLRLGPWNPLSPKSPYASAIFLHESYVAASLPNGLRCPVLLLQPNSCPGPKPFGHCPRRSPPPPASPTRVGSVVCTHACCWRSHTNTREEPPWAPAAPPVTGPSSGRPLPPGPLHLHLPLCEPQDAACASF